MATFNKPISEFLSLYIYIISAFLPVSRAISLLQSFVRFNLTARTVPGLCCRSNKLPLSAKGLIDRVYREVNDQPANRRI